MSLILDESKLEESIQSLATVIAKKILPNTILLGIELKGKLLATRVSEKINKIKSIKLKVGLLDVNLFRPLNKESYRNVGESEISFSLKNKHIILISPFIITGQSIQAALVALNDYDDPDSIECACLLANSKLTRPIYINYIANSKIQAKKSFLINFFESDGEDSITENK